MDNDVKELLNTLLSEMGKMNTKVDKLQNDIEELCAENREEHAHLIGVIARQGLDMESMSQDMNYLVKREADNRHRMMIMNKSFQK